MCDRTHLRWNEVWKTDLTSLIFLQLQPDRHPALRVIREALWEAPDSCGGDMWLCSGVNHRPVQPASYGSKHTKQPQSSFSPPPLLQDRRTCVSWQTSASPASRRLQRRGVTTQGRNSQTSDSSQRDSGIVSHYHNKLQRNLINVPFVPQKSSSYCLCHWSGGLMASDCNARMFVLQ